MHSAPVGARVSISSTVAHPYNGLVGVVERKTKGESSGKVIYHVNVGDAFSTATRPFYASELERAR